MHKAVHILGQPETWFIISRSKLQSTQEVATYKSATLKEMGSDQLRGLRHGASRVLLTPPR